MNYDRENDLKERLNSFIQSELGLPSDDYYSRLNQKSFLDLKSVLNDINNIFTLKVTLAFADWLANSLSFDGPQRDQMVSSVLGTNPSTNGYDIEVTAPRKVIAEVKCNVPINGGSIFGSGQRDGISEDLKNLVEGKSKSTMDPHQSLKFMVLLDTPEVRAATKQFLKNNKIYPERIVEVGPDDKVDGPEKIFVKYIGFLT